MVLGDYRPRTLPINADAITEMLSPKPLEGEEKLAIIFTERISQFAALDRERTTCFVETQNRDP